MAKREQEERLKRSVQEWNVWVWRNRHQEEEEEIDLSGANLINAKLIRADLTDTVLTGADISGADLTDADFCTADLTGADLTHAKLNGAHLIRAVLIDADLTGADLTSTDLTNADLTDAHLSHAEMSHALLYGTVFASNDFCLVKGLATAKHEGPSHVDLYSIKLPQDGSALHFLRGVGVPDEWIDFYRAQMMPPIQYYSVFISYSSKDEQLARRLHADLQDQGVRCWFAPHDMRPGTVIRKEIDKAIHLQDKLLLLLSKGAITSGWVDYEVEVALAREREQQREILFPVRLDETVLQSTDGWAATLRRTRHIGNFTNWTDPQSYQIAFERLLRDLKATQS